MNGLREGFAASRKQSIVSRKSVVKHSLPVVFLSSSDSLLKVTLNSVGMLPGYALGDF